MDGSISLDGGGSERESNEHAVIGHPIAPKIKQKN